MEAAVPPGKVAGDRYAAAICAGTNLVYRRAAIVGYGLRRIHVNVDFWEAEVDACLERRRPGEPASITLCPEAAADENFCRELLNCVPSDTVNNRNQTVTIWVKKHPDMPNDHRDTLRMARVAAERWKRGMWEQPEAPPQEPAPSSPVIVEGGATETTTRRRLATRHRLPRRR